MCALRVLGLSNLANEHGWQMWSLGCIIAEMYTGYPIFPGENEQEQLACIMEVMGLPDKYLIERASRRRLFFGESVLCPRSSVLLLMLSQTPLVHPVQWSTRKGEDDDRTRKPLRKSCAPMTTSSWTSSPNVLFGIPRNDSNPTLLYVVRAPLRPLVSS